MVQGLQPGGDNVSRNQDWHRRSRDGDHATTGRCSNNLGIISNLRGRHAEAIGSWEIAVAAFDRAGLRQGVAECHHNLGITYREQGALDRALAEADQAVAEAEAIGDRSLWALTLRGRAEIRVVRGEFELARCELDLRRQRHLPRDRDRHLLVGSVSPLGRFSDFPLLAALPASPHKSAHRPKAPETADSAI